MKKITEIIRFSSGSLSRAIADAHRGTLLNRSRHAVDRTPNETK